MSTVSAGPPQPKTLAALCTFSIMYPSPFRTSNAFARFTTQLCPRSAVRRSTTSPTRWATVYAAAQRPPDETYLAVYLSARANIDDRRHWCFKATSRSAVQAFHEAALRFGGSSGGPPGLRENYHPSYYAAFVRDPHGNRLEAVCHVPE